MQRLYGFGWNKQSGTAAVITVSPSSLSFPDTQVGNTSAAQSYTLNGSGLMTDITVTPPPGFQVSLTLVGGYTTGALTVPQVGGMVNAIIYVQFVPQLVQAYTETITNSSSGATAVVSVDGTGISPAIIINPTSLDFGDVGIGDTSPTQFYDVQGINLLANLVITPPSNWQISLTPVGGYTSSSITIVPAGGSVPSTTIYARFQPLVVQAYSGNITNVSAGAVTRNVAVTGNGVDPYIVATGGTMTRDGDYLVHTFNSSDNLVVTNAPLGQTIEYLIVAGGGGAGTCGAGGAGGFRTASGMVLAVQSYPIVVGDGGAGSSVQAQGSNGSDSSFNGITSAGGGGGGGFITKTGLSGGSGGGGLPVGAGTTGQGNNGGLWNFAVGSSPGGGGAGAVGQDSNSASPGGDGGIGLSSSISGSPTYYAGGGGGAGTIAGGNGGLGGGGNGGISLNNPTGATAGTANSGGGGGSGGTNTAGENKAGGSGIVIIRYYHPISIYMTATGGTVTTDGDYKVHTFNSSGNFQVLTNPDNEAVEYLIVAGGGGSAASDNAGGNGGGGAGGLLNASNMVVLVGTYPFVIGAGGAAGSGSGGAFGTRGSDSTALGLTAIGGGAGKASQPDVGNSMNGGSGAGTGRTGGGSQNGGIGVVGQGHDGGDTPTISGSGGGGAGAVGQDSQPGNNGGNGGNGLQLSISGTPTYYAGGGGGGAFNGGIPGTGGLGGGANGDPSGSNGTPNTGGGAGGIQGFPVSTGVSGGAGGSGIIIVRYKFQ